ncbi:hypothetical protein TNCV_3065491 [Trichonephila clavipes]|uniref:Uncharacterized protein n=1 Tax=Trichonephila clavipes TaxID=2585209 RepID=A0A8X6RLL7_TRICX|nr:hypothetical protein TNCV_3065491 [Trichonephila clavipes]
MGVSKSVISQLKKVAEGENALRNHTDCQGRYTTPLKDLYVALVAKRNRNFTPDRTAANLATAASTHVSARAISQSFSKVLFCMHGSMFVTSHFSHSIIERDYASLRNMLVGITKIGLEKGYSTFFFAGHPTYVSYFTRDEG